MKWLVLFSVLVFTFSSCNTEKTTEISFVLEPTYNGVAITPNQILQDVNGRNFSVKEFRLYISDFDIIGPFDTPAAGDNLQFVDWPASNFVYKVATNGDISGVEFHIGMDSITNESNPIDFAPEHPLSNQQDMHWGMLKYRFLTFIGHVDTTATGDQNPTNLLQYHLGRDELYTKVIVNKDITIPENSTEYKLTFDVAKLFSGPAGDIDIRTHRTNHSGLADMPNANIIINNLAAAIELE